MLFPSAFRSINRFHNSCAKRLGRLADKHRGASGERFRARVVRGAASVGLVLCLLTSSTPAATQTIVDVAKESSVSFLFWYRASGLAKLIQGQGIGNARGQEKQAERDAKISRLQIFPGDVTIDLSDHVRFSAVAYDRDGNPVGGVKIKWSGQSSVPSRHVRLSPHGEFEAIFPGTFKVVAEAGGKTAQVSVVVRPSVKRDLNLVPTSTRQVSSRDLPTTKVGSTKGTRQSEVLSSRPRNASGRLITAAKRSHASREAAVLAAEPMPQGGGGGWGSSNYWSAGDPANAVGNPSGVAADGGAGSGNFQFAAPILSLPAREINIALGLSYNSRLWNKANTQISYDNDRGWPAPGFSLGFGKVLGMGVYGGGMLVDADGTRHAYTGSITFYSWGTYGVMHTTDGSLIDYTYWTGTGGGIVSAWAKLPNGTVISYGVAGPGAVYPTFIEDANGNYITITYVNNAGPQIQTVTDTMGRTISFYYDANNLLTAITAPGYTGGTRTLVRLHYSQLALNYGFSGTLTPSVRDSYPWVIDAIYYPANNTGYWFGDSASRGYLFGNSDSYSSYGMLAKVVQVRGMTFSGPDPVPPAQGPTGQGTITSAGQMTRRESYNYPLTPDYSLTDAPTYTSMLEEWSRDGVTFDSATTGYEVHENDNPRKTIITLPNGTKSKHLAFNAPGQYNDGLVYHDETYVTDNQPLQSSNSYWEQGAYNTPRPTRVEKTDEQGQTTAAAFSYGSVYNQVTEVRDYDYGGTTLLRATRTTYQNSANYTNRHIFNLPVSVEMYAADYATRVSRTEYQYDGQALTSASGVVMHDATSDPYTTEQVEGSTCCQWEWDEWEGRYCVEYCLVSAYRPETDYRGNVTQATSYADATSLTGAVTETRRYDITGNLVTTSTSCCQQSSFNYTVDTQYAYPLSKTRGSATDAYGQVTTSAAYDFNTGLARLTKDANGRPSITDYDPSTLRLTSATSSTGAHTDLIYDDSAMTVTSTTYPTPGAGGGIANQNVKLLNGRGQVRQEKALGVSNAWDYVDTVYNNMGQVSQQTQPYRSGEAQLLSSVSFDALGRTVSVTAPDGSVTQTFYNEATRPDVASTNPGETTRVRDPWGRERWGRADSSGRLVEVVEPNPSGDGSVANGGLVTTYSYNTLGNLTTISQGSQTRSFKCDSLGRLTAQKLSEISATLNDAGAYVGSGTWSDVFTYDDRSNLTSRTDARGVKTVYTYNSDPLNRLLSVSWDTSGFGDTANPILSAAAVTYQYRHKVGSSDLIDITQPEVVTTSGISTETYGYDWEGRLSSKSVTVNGRPSMDTNYSYDTLDRATDVLYPAEYGNGSAPRKVVHNNYDIASRLSSLTFDSQTQASNIDYNAASQTKQLSVGTGTNQVNEVYTYSAQTGLVDSQTLTRNGNTLLNLSYDYTNASGKRMGQLTKITNNLDTNGNHNRSYTYDALGRLTQAKGGQFSAPTWTQNYSYDRYGNRVSAPQPSCNSSQTLNSDQFIQNFYSGALNRPPTSPESQSANNQLYGAYYQGQTQLFYAAGDLGRQLFNSQEYINRGRSNHDYVYDLYWAYLQRAPDQPSWDAWTSAVATDGREHVRLGFALSAEFAAKTATLCPHGLNATTPVPADGIANLSFDAATNRITTSGYLYDAAGNQVRAPAQGGGSQRFKYDAANRLVQVLEDNNTTVRAAYTYGDSNERLIADEAGYRTYYASEGGTTIAEYIESGSSTTPAWSKSYVYLGNRLLSTLTPNGNGGEAVTYYHPDLLGTRLITTDAASNPSGTTAQEQLTLPFGAAFTETPAASGVISGGTNRRFTSYDRSDTTKLDYAINRHYDPQQGRFTQVDPAGMGATSLANPQTLNLYAYCGNDPINRTDPSGLGLISALKRAFKKILQAFIHAVITAVIAFVMSGFNLGAALAVFAADFLMQIGWQSQGYWHNQSGTPPIFSAGGVTLSQIFQGTILAKLFPSPQDLLRFVIPINGFASPPPRIGLSDCVRRLLAPFFLKAGILFPRPLDLGAVRLHVGLPSAVKEFAVIDVEAITINSDIYAKDVHRFEGRNWDDIELIAHELTHVQQYQRIRTLALGSRGWGTIAFGASYLGGFLGGLVLGKGPERAEHDNPFEKAAEDRAAEIVKQLKAQGKKPCL